MALKFSKVEAVQFDDITEVPVITAERRLRLQALKLKEADREKVCETLASCFEEHTAEIKTFMLKHMSMSHLAKLQTYILEGEDGLADYEERLKVANNEAVKRVMGKFDTEELVNE